jgi:hypothetical protein
VASFTAETSEQVIELKERLIAQGFEGAMAKNPLSYYGGAGGVSVRVGSSMGFSAEQEASLSPLSVRSVASLLTLTQPTIFVG